MKNRTIKIAAAVAAVALLAGGYCAYRMRTPPDVNAEVSKTDALVREMENAGKEFVRLTGEHRATTRRKVVAIRETVSEDVFALGSDDLSAAALYEIRLYLGRGGTGSDAGPGGVDVTD